MGFDPQTVDVENEYDPRLTYRENKQKFANYLAKTKIPSRREQKKQLILQLEKRHSQRSPRSQRMDEEKAHSRTVKLSNLKDRLIDRWWHDPGKLDIETIDDLQAFDYRKRKEHKKQEEQTLATRLDEFSRKKGKDTFTERELEKKFGKDGVKELMASALVYRHRKNEFRII